MYFLKFHRFLTKKLTGIQKKFVRLGTNNYALQCNMLSEQLVLSAMYESNAYMVSQTKTCETLLVD